MSAPPLPEVFGNYALREFAEVIPPEGISWLPQTAGWLWLAIALSGVIAYYAWRAIKNWYHNRYRREAISRLRALAQSPGSADLVSDINRILKITALVAYSRENVAKLSGQTWADFLNRQCEQPPFNAEQQLLLASAIYRNAATNRQTTQQLMAASMLWVSQHKAPRHPAIRGQA